MQHPATPAVPPGSGPVPWSDAEARELRERALAREQAPAGPGEGGPPGDPALSLAELNRASSLDPSAARTDTRLAFHRGRLLARLGRAPEAAAELERALVLDRDHAGLGAGERGQAHRLAGLVLGEFAAARGDAEGLGAALRHLNQALEAGARDGVGDALDRFKDALMVLPVGSQGFPAGAGPAEPSRAPGGLRPIVINERAVGYGDRDAVKERLGRLHPQAFEPLAAGRWDEAVGACVSFLKPRFQGADGLAAVLEGLDEADLLALGFLGSALRGAGRDGEAAGVLRVVMSQSGFQGFILPEVQFVFRTSYEELRGLAARRGWLWVNDVAVAGVLFDLLGGPSPRAPLPSAPAPSSWRPVPLPWTVMVLIAAALLLAVWRWGWA